ncbi:hypothetical protein J4E91_005256 [Alternaria rosae]|nr:hypothetical protein J4E91_005256 [Alternaria rosae]
MSTSNPHPAAQIASLNNRLLALKTLILDYRKLIERTLLSIAHDTISGANEAQVDTEFHLDKAPNRREMLEETAVWMDGRTHAKALLTRFEDQMEALEAYQKAQLDDFYDTDMGYDMLKADIAPQMITKEETAVVLKVRQAGRQLYQLAKKADEVLAKEMADENEVWKEILSTDEKEGFAREFIELVAGWSRVNR